MIQLLGLTLYRTLMHMGVSKFSGILTFMEFNTGGRDEQ